MNSLHLPASQSAVASFGEEFSGVFAAETSRAFLRAIGLASLVLGATAAGLFIGRELRQRYKFKRRTPYDFYSKAGDSAAITEYGMGI